MPRLSARRVSAYGLVTIDHALLGNQHTATLDCDGQKWRVAFELLRHLVDV